MRDPMDAELEARFRASMPDEPEGPCPPAEVLWSAAIGDMGVDRLTELTTHLASCGVCGQALALSAELATQREPGVADARRSLVRWRRAPLTTVGVGLTALAAGLVLTLWLRSAPPVERPQAPLVVASRGGSADPGAIRPLSAEVQPAADLRLEWTPVVHAVRYRVQVSSEDLQPLYDRTVERGTSLQVPPAVTGRAPGTGGGQLLQWQVDAILPDGRVVASPTFSVRVSPPDTAPR